MLSISNNYFSRVSAPKYNAAPKVSDMPALKPLKKDTVSFGYIDVGLPPKDLQIYRAIGKSELDALLNGECIEGYSYATSDPRGWQATSWHNGFSGVSKDTYFVTFKTGYLDIEDRRDSLEDTRYGVEPYTLKDVKNIRKGHNVHGELIYAPDFENAKIQDIKDKKQQIKKLIASIKNNKKPTKIEKFFHSLKNLETALPTDLQLFDDYDELSSFCKEFPEIIDELKPLANKDDRHAYHVMALIFYGNRAQDLSYVRDYVNNCLKKELRINDLATKYLYNQGKNEDLALLFKMFQKGETHNINTVYAMRKVASAEDEQTVKDAFVKANIIDQYYLWYFFEDSKETVPLARFVLDKYKNESQNKMFEDYRITALISNCCQSLKENGNPDDIKYLKPYANDGDSYANTDAVIAMNTLMKKSSK